MSEDAQDLGFQYRELKSGDVEVLHHGRRASTLRGRDAVDFLAEIDGAKTCEAQHVMARITGNYKRGNERLASQHQRNRQ